ncbi:MAG: hypothetical protein PHV03_11240, partial [Desulfitobacteriaceae bacterium]|nr:hypothetical protein [Desulfitobacteriaceae bacterium]
MRKKLPILIFAIVILLQACFSVAFAVSAEVQAMLQPFNDPIRSLFRTQEPFEVWGAQAVEMHVVAPKTAYNGMLYPVYYGLENVSDINVYNPQISIQEGENYTIYSTQTVNDIGKELEPGEIYWLECLLIPNFSEGAV